MLRTILAITLFLFLPNTTHAAVLINEILPKPTVEIEEWIELYNNGSDPVSLSEWKINTYSIPPGTTIAANGFATFNRSQTGVELNDEGDTVKLFDAGGALVDSQSYPDILGYNTSMGRSSDGAGVWTTCTSWTKHLTNNCPAPTHTPTPWPTREPTKTPTPTPPAGGSPTLTPTSVPQTTPTPTLLFTQAGQPVQSQVLGKTDEPTNNSQRWLGVISLCVAAVAGVLLFIRRRRKIS